MSYVCTTCSKLVETPGKFCPYCGQQNIEQEVGVSQGEQIKIYVLSVILAPLGLYWFFKFFRSEDLEKRKVGYIALIITLVVVLVISSTTYYAIQQVKEIYDPLLETYKEL